MNSFIIKDALKLLEEKGFEYTFEGNQDAIIYNAYSISELSDFGLSFYRNEDIDKYKDLFNQTNLVLVKNELKNKLPKANFIYSDNPSLCFNIVGWLLKKQKKTFIHPTAIIDTNTVIGNNVYIGAYSVIGDNTTIANNVIIEEHCIIKNTQIGNNVKIQTGAKLGNMGLGSQMDNQGVWHDFPHFGMLIIEDNVLIQDNAIINRGTLNNTIIGANTRIGPLTWIAHGVIIGKSCFISQATTIAGSSCVGNFTKVWGNASIKDGIKIGANCIIGLGAVVTKDIPGGETWFGNPATPMKKTEPKHE